MFRLNATCEFHVMLLCLWVVISNLTRTKTQHEPKNHVRHGNPNTTHAITSWHKYGSFS
ncbi:hypothetical protein HanIR_Chr13g0663951 [Helianthus annuus]|nr:hypothetical protein HanIR_Chr13g0663951 [Helianthus annuus]